MRNNKRRYEFEIAQILLSLVIIVMVIILAFQFSELTILYPIVFGLSAILCVIYALEGILYNRNRVVKRTRVIVFGIVAVILVFFTVISAMIIAG